MFDSPAASVGFLQSFSPYPNIWRINQRRLLHVIVGPIQSITSIPAIFTVTIFVYIVIYIIQTTIQDSYVDVKQSVQLLQFRSIEIDSYNQNVRLSTGKCAHVTHYLLSFNYRHAGENNCCITTKAACHSFAEEKLRLLSRSRRYRERKCADTIGTVLS